MSDCYQWVLPLVPLGVTPDTCGCYSPHHWVLRQMPSGVTEYRDCKAKTSCSYPPTTYSLQEEGEGEGDRGARERPLPPPQAIAGCLVVYKTGLEPTRGQSRRILGTVYLPFCRFGTG